MTDDLLTVALAYAKRGYAVFPLGPGSKLPLIPSDEGGHGALDATTDPAQIRAWWTETPDANIGITAGASGLLLVDVDNKDGRDGFTSWEVLRVQHGLDDRTPHVWTPNDGKHLYFRAPAGVQLRNTDNELGPGIETKANGKYLVAPPSRLKDGRLYRWDESLNLDTVPVAAVPAALCELLQARAPERRTPMQQINATGELATVEDALRYIGPWDRKDYDWWLSILMAIHSKFPGSDGLRVAEAWADGKEGEVEGKWKGFDTDGGITLGTLYAEAERRGWPAPWHAPRNGTSTYPVEPAWLQDAPSEPVYLPADELAAHLDAAPDMPRPKRKTSWTAAELLDADFPEPQWAVPGLVPAGLTILAGRPKIGKSWLALQIAIAVGTGGMVLDRRVTAGRVLYLALEDNERRLKERASKQGMTRNAAVRFETTWRKLTEGGLDDLYSAIREDGITLAVIDTLGRALGRADQADLADMTELVGGLQEYAVSHDMAILVIDHHRKPAGFAGDPVDDIVGSTAKSAVADAVLGLFKEQGKRGATLRVTGRDVEWQDLALSWDVTTCCWQYDGTTEEVAMQGNRGKVVDALGEHGDSMTLTAIASATGITKNNLLPILNDLVTDGVIERLEKQGREVPYRIRA
jgi:hypothetical protein